MSFAVTMFSLINAWMMAATAMLWGMLRIARRRHSKPQRIATEPTHAAVQSASVFISR